MNSKNSKIFVIDDDEEVRQSLTLLLNSAGYPAEPFSSAEDFLNSVNYKGPGCILLDVFFKDRSGLELQEQISAANIQLPIIFMSGHGNISMSVQALKNGAINFLEKPIDDKKLFRAIEEALLISNSKIMLRGEIEKLRPLLNTLTPREYEVFQYVINGMLNKEIAIRLGIAEHTVKNHRLKITSKLQVKSVAEMIRIAEILNVINPSET